MVRIRDEFDDKDLSDSNFHKWFRSSWRKIFAEFLSTLMLVLLGCMTTVPMAGTNSPVYGALGFGTVVMFNIQIFGHISGAYMNPSVTLSAMISSKISLLLGVSHIIAECLGAVAGYGILDAVTSMNLKEDAVCVTKPLQGQHYLQSLGIEIAITATLMLVLCALWDPVNAKFQEEIPVKFGLTILGLSLVGGPFTGASMNPARSLGPAVWTDIWTQHWIYWAGPFLGSIVGTLIYNLIFLKRPNNY